LRGEWDGKGAPLPRFRHVPNGWRQEGQARGGPKKTRHPAGIGKIDEKRGGVLGKGRRLDGKKRGIRSLGHQIKFVTSS